IESAKYESSRLPPVVFSINVENRNHNQVGIDESNHAAKANATVPQNRRQWDIPDGTDERNDGNNRPDDRPPEFCQQWMIGKEKGLPEVLWYPCSHRPGKQQAASDILPHRNPIHNEVMTDSG